MEVVLEALHRRGRDRLHIARIAHELVGIATLEGAKRRTVDLERQSVPYRVRTHRIGIERYRVTEVDVRSVVRRVASGPARLDRDTIALLGQEPGLAREHPLKERGLIFANVFESRFNGLSANIDNLFKC